MATDWIPGAALGVVACALNFWRGTGITEAVLSGNLDALRREFRIRQETDGKAEAAFRVELEALRDEMNIATQEFRKAAFEIARLSSSQEAVNAYTAKALDSITRQQENHNHAMVENAATLRLLGELLTRIQERNER